MNKARGVSLVELMLSITLGLILSLAIIGVYLAQISTYKTNTAQAAIQDSENAISALVVPIIRSAGFCGCNSVTKAISGLVPGGPPPLGTFNTTQAMIAGYDEAAGTVININQNNAPNSANTNLWSPILDPSLIGDVEATSDVLIVLGPLPGSQPIGVTAVNPASNNIVVQNSGTFSAGTFGALSDCSKASILSITSVSGNILTFSQGGTALTNASGGTLLNFTTGAQFISLTQTAFFVAQDPSGQSALVHASMRSDGTWTIQSFIPGVDTMLVLYGIGSNGVVSQYVPASAVGNWGQVYAVRLGFLLEGKTGSQTLPPTQYSLLGSTITVPADNRLRHTFELTILLRNAS